MSQIPSSTKALTLDEVLNRLSSRSPWTLLNGAIELRLSGLDFNQVTALVQAINQLSQDMNHHPDVSYGYSNLTVRYQTHDVGGLTDLDFACADRILTLLG
jgi:4a-hydroxytetrahydrobiopterin dehydratase